MFVHYASNPLSATEISCLNSFESSDLFAFSGNYVIADKAGRDALPR